MLLPLLLHVRRRPPAHLLLVGCLLPLLHLLRRGSYVGYVRIVPTCLECSGAYLLLLLQFVLLPLQLRRQHGLGCWACRTTFWVHRGIARAPVLVCIVGARARGAGDLHRRARGQPRQ